MPPKSYHLIPTIIFQKDISYFHLADEKLRPQIEQFPEDLTMRKWKNIPVFDTIASNNGRKIKFKNDRLGMP